MNNKFNSTYNRKSIELSRIYSFITVHKKIFYNTIKTHNRISIFPHSQRVLPHGPQLKTTRQTNAQTHDDKSDYVKMSRRTPLINRLHTETEK